MMQDKRVFWQYEIEGQRDITREVEKMILETADEYKQQADATNKAVRTVTHITHHVKNILFILLAKFNQSKETNLQKAMIAF